METAKTITAPDSGLRIWNDQEPLIYRIFQIAIFLSLFSVALGANDSQSEGSFLRQISWGMMGLFSLSQIVLDRYKTARINFSFGGTLLWCLLLFALCSTIWSKDPMVTFKRSVLLSLVVLLCVAAMGKIRSANFDFGRAIGLPLLILFGLSLLLTGVAPGRAFTEIGWRGATSHKNEMGQLTAVLLLMLLYGNIIASWRYRLLAVALCGAGLVISKSSTATVGVAFAIVVTTMMSMPSIMKSIDSWKRLLLGALLFAITVLYFSFLFDILPPPDKIIDGIFGLMGKSSTLTGRTEIWQRVLSESRYHNPWFGGGYGAFWVGPQSASGFMLRATGNYPGQAHNGYLDVYNDLGYLGLGLVVLLLLSAIYKLRAVFLLKHREAKLHLGIIGMVLAVNYAESTLFRSTQFANILFLASYIRISAITTRAERVS